MKQIFKILFFHLILSSIATAQNVTRMATASGTDTYAATFNPPLTSLNSSTLYVITFTNANTSTTVTLNPDGAVGATAIKDNAGSDPAIGAIVAGGTYTLRFNGTNFRIAGSTWEVIRTGATTQKCNATFSGGDGSASSYYSTAGETLSGTVAIVLTGESGGAASNDVVMETIKIGLENGDKL